MGRYAWLGHLCGIGEQLNLVLFLVVTGASDGLGRQYALQLAKKGFNVALVSRTPSKIEKVAN